MLPPVYQLSYMGFVSDHMDEVADLSQAMIEVTDAKTQAVQRLPLYRHKLEGTSPQLLQLLFTNWAVTLAVKELLPDDEVPTPEIHAKIVERVSELKTMVKELL